MKRFLTLLGWFYLISLVTLPISTKSQNALRVTTTGKIYVSPGARIYVKGNTNDSGKIQNNTGTVTFNGNISVPGKYISNGNEVFGGTGNKTVLTSVKDTNYFGHVVKQNTGNIILDSDLDCDSITFTVSGKIMITNTDTIRVKSGAATAIKGYSSSSYIDVDDYAILSRKASGTGITYVWPMGNFTSGYHRFDILLSSLGTTGSSFIHGKLVSGGAGTISYSKYYPTGFSGNYPGQDCSTGSNPQWVEFTCMTPNYYNFSGPTDYQSIVTAWASACSPAGAGPQRVLQSEIGLGNWTNRVDSVTGTLTTQLCLNSYWRGGVATSIPGGTYRGFGDFAIAGGYGAPLPVELVMFKGYRSQDKNVLIWETASERNTDKFEVYRSADNSNDWTFIGSQKAVGGSKPTDYTLYDNDPMIGNNYYRLKIIDNDRTFDYSNVINIPITAIEMNSIVGIYPNPASESIIVKIQSTKNYAPTIKIFDVLGQILIEESITVQEGANKLPIDIANLANGTYMLSMEDVLGNNLLKKFVKQ